MIWGAPAYLWFLLVVPLLGLATIWAGMQWRRKLATQIDPRLWSRLTGGQTGSGRKWRELLLFTALAASLLAAARPQFGSRLVQVKRSGVDVVVALDASASMDAADVVPSRILRSRREVADLIERLRGDRIGIIVFEGDAFLLCPLTLDYGAARLFLDAVETRMLPTPGSNLAEAIDAALASFPKEGSRSKAIVVFSDGEAFEGDVAAAANRAREADVRIYCVGVGTPAGEPIPERDESGEVSGYKKDRGGQVVLSRLDERTLRDLAENSGGRYYPATLAGGEIEAIYKSLADLEQSTLKAGLRTRHEERFQAFAALGAVALIVWLGWPVARRREEWNGRI